MQESLFYIMKKDGLFDGTMGAYDGAEVCGLFY